MTLLAYNELCELVERGVITNVKPEQINASSIDLTLGAEAMLELHTPNFLGQHVISLRKREALRVRKYMTTGGIRLSPGAFMLAQSEQVFNLPNNISAEYKLKSSMARMGLEHLNAGWCDAGWNGSVLTLELKNMTQSHIIELVEGDAIGQVVFFKHAEVPEGKSYATRGRYNNDTTVKGVKP